jgi:hypothetical protein
MAEKGCVQDVLAAHVDTRNQSMWRQVLVFVADLANAQGDVISSFEPHHQASSIDTNPMIVIAQQPNFNKSS